MIRGKYSSLISAAAVMFFSILVTCPVSLAQGPLPDAPAPVGGIEHASALVTITPTRVSEHRFWDKENKLLFVTAAAVNGADFAITRSNLQNGGRELNPVVRIFGRSTPGLGINFAAETAGVVSVSYFFHKTGHHKLERLTSIVDIGASAAAVSYGLAHR